jgi:DNA-binding transcriptional MerR regulator
MGRELAARSAVSVKTIRFYCDQGLLQPSGRSEGRYRIFDKSVDSDLALICTLQGLELPLPTIKAVLKSLHAELNGLLTTWQRCGGRPAQVSAGN